jgi:hypothetical protein
MATPTWSHARHGRSRPPHAGKGERQSTTHRGISSPSFRLENRGVEVLKFSRRTTIIASTMALVVATSVVAFAFWTGVGAGTGQAQTGNTGQALVVKQTGPPTGLVPGGPAATLSGNFDNPNAAGVFVNTVKATIASVTPAVGPDLTKPNCQTSDFQLVNDTATVNDTIPPGNGQGAWGGITIKMLNTAANQDNCKNATVNLSYTIV